MKMRRPWWKRWPLCLGSTVAPLVMKCDNGPAFRAHLTKRFLLGREVFTLYSPPYRAQYNGGCERANRTLKELTEHVAEQAGRRDFWTSDDLLVARPRQRTEPAMGSDGRNAGRNLVGTRRIVAGQTRKHVATLKERDCDCSGPARARSDSRAFALPPSRDRAHRGASRPRTARSPSRHEETNYSGVLTPNRCKNYGGGTQNHCEKIVTKAGGLKKKIDANLVELQEHVQRLAEIGIK